MGAYINGSFEPFKKTRVKTKSISSCFCYSLEAKIENHIKGKKRVGKTQANALFFRVVATLFYKIYEFGITLVLGEFNEGPVTGVFVQAKDKKI